MEGFVNALHEWGGKIVEEVSLTLLKHIDHQGHFVCYPTKEAMAVDRETLHAELRAIVDGDHVYAGLVCDGESVEETVPDDESELVRQAILGMEEKIISIPFPGRDRIFTRLVAMNKSLLKALLSDQGYSPWRLARLSLKLKDTDWIQDTAAVRLINNVGDMMTRSKILFDDKVIGEIQFARRRV